MSQITTITSKTTNVHGEEMIVTTGCGELRLVVDTDLREALKVMGDTRDTPKMDGFVGGNSIYE